MVRAHAITRILPASVCPVKALVPFLLHRPSRRACSTWSGRPPWLASVRMVPANDSPTGRAGSSGCTLAILPAGRHPRRDLVRACWYRAGAWESPTPRSAGLNSGTHFKPKCGHHFGEEDTVPQL